LRALRAETERHPHGGMHFYPEQGQLMRLLIELTGAKEVLKIGVFTGYSTLSVTLTLPHDDRLIAC
jgi:predicted O-methyltransferase YrrM